MVYLSKAYFDPLIYLRYSEGEYPVFRLKKRLKNAVLGKLSLLEISFIVN